MSTFESSFGPQFYAELQKDQPCFGIAIPEKQFRRSEQTQSQFGLSNNKQKINIKQFQFQQKIILLKVQLQVQAVFNVFQPKVSNVKRYAFKKIIHTKSPEEINYIQQKISFQYANQMVQKLNNFAKIYQLKLIAKGFSNIALKNMFLPRSQTNLNKNKKVKDKRDSQNLKLNSKLDENSLRISDLGGPDEQTSNYSSSNNPKARNKQLNKKRNKQNKNLNQFLSKMDDLLSSHEQFLKKR